jgi:hypothetical protein
MRENVGMTIARGTVPFRGAGAVLLLNTGRVEPI